MSFWAVSIIAGILTDFSFEWLFLVGLAEPFSDVSEAKYLDAYTIDLEYSKNRIILIRKHSARKLSIIAAFGCTPHSILSARTF